VIKSLAILPVFNESRHIGGLLDRFSGVACDVLVVDDGSTDSTTEEIQRRSFPVVRHSERRGVGKCLQDGFGYAKEHGYDVVVVMAGNGKDNPQEIPKLLSAIESGADYVQGSRFLKGGQWNNLPTHRFFAIKIFTWIWSLCTWHWLTDVTNGFRAYRLSFLNRPEVLWNQPWLETYELEYYLHYRALHAGIPFREVAVTKNYPTKTNYSKIRPGKDWIRIIKPLFVLITGLRK
jgi:dolichol-phosphate mannosyltransferase